MSHGIHTGRHRPAHHGWVHVHGATLILLHLHSLQSLLLDRHGLLVPWGHWAKRRLHGRLDPSRSHGGWWCTRGELWCNSVRKWLVRRHEPTTLRRIHPARMIRLRGGHLRTYRRAAAGGREWARGGSTHALDTVLVEILHDWRLGDTRRRSSLEVLIRSGMGRKLRRAIGRWLIPRERHLVRSLRPRRGQGAGSWSRGHGHTIFGTRSFGRNHLVWILEAGRDISRQAIEHALLELVRVRSR